MFTPSAELQREWCFGKAHQRPIKIFASINTRSFGEFVLRLLYVNSVAEQFDNREVTLLYRNDTDFKQALVKLLPDAKLVKVSVNSYLPSLDLISPRTVHEIPGFEHWTGHAQDLVITEGMATEIGLLGFDRLGYLRIPDDHLAYCCNELIQRGIRPDKWFVTVHARESGYYTAARNTYRNANLEAYKAAVDHILDMGGQVIRLGHPQLTSFGKMPGLLELGLEPGAALLQAFAVSRARYMLAGPSGPMALAEAFHIPTAYANSWDLYLCNDRAIVRTVDLISPDGTLYNQERIVDMIPHGLKPLLESGYRTEQVSSQEMIRLVSEVHRVTEDCLGWREPEPIYRGDRPNTWTWPGELRSKSQWLEEVKC